MTKTFLTKPPFNLNDAQIEFVENTINGMSLDEKVGQLFLPINFIEDEEGIRAFVKQFKPGGVLNRPAPAEVNWNRHRIFQDESDIPMFIAANIESGGNGAVREGTAFGNPLQVAAAGDVKYARELGKIAGAEGRAVGVNYAFAPIIDIDYNTLNPITNTRTFGNDPETVYKLADAYIDGLMEGGKNMCYSLKHFPGDGVDHRDQHLHTTYNTLSVEEWENTYGKNYRRLIEKGATTVMVGHIGLPEYVKEINPDATLKEILAPGSLSKEIVTGLLRERMGFNGMIITDSTSMNGFYAHMSRKLAVPTAIANGCDMFLFNYCMAEDFEFMKQGIEAGILSMARVDEALSRIIGLKVAMGLFENQKNHTLVPEKEALEILGNEDFQKLAAECAKQAVTLVKDEEKLLPITPQTHKRLIAYVMGDREDFYGNKKVSSRLIDRLKEQGFEVEIFDYSVHFPDPNETMQSFIDKYDAALYILSEGTSSNQTTVRLTWNLPLANDAPWFVNDIPTIAVSFANPYHLRDMPEIGTYINAYTTNDFNVDAVVEKLMGKSEFTGKNPVDTTCGCYELRLKEAMK